MLQQYKNLLIHINSFQFVYNNDIMRYQEMYYRYILDKLYPHYNMFLLGNDYTNTEIIVESLGLFSYFENIFKSSTDAFKVKDFYRIMSELLIFDQNQYLVFGNNIHSEIDSANRCGMDTCLLVNDYNSSIIESNYKIDSFEKIKIIL